MTRRILLAACGLALMACRTQKAEFCNKVFECDLHAAQDPCGKSCTGKPMTCYPASQLGGTDFCTEACDPAQGSDDPAFTCMTSGALLRLCHPHAAATDPSMGCPDGLQCYRTDLLKDDGVCVAVPVCTTNNDCPGQERNICAATILRELYGVPADNLQCLQRSCTSSVTQCLPGESCLASYYEVGPTPDICVPNCEKEHCPPNFSCASVTSGAGSPSICVPGIPGVRCVSDQDCLIGSCVDTGAGFSECVPPIPCSSNLDCAPFDSTTSLYVCLKRSPTGPGACFSTAPFRGANCNETVASPQGHCPDGRACNHYSPYIPGEASGECRVPCDGDKKCPAIGGIPHICLDDGAGGCYPTGFAMPCNTSADCFTEFACQAVSADERTVITSPAICTLACVTDGDCSKHPMILTTGFCKEGLCRLGGMAGNLCESNEQCREGTCLLDAGGQKRCRI